MPFSQLLRQQTKLLLGSLREGREVRQYIDKFGTDDDRCFAVIKVGGAVVEQDLEILGQRLALLQSLGLKPVVVYGSGPQLDKQMAAAGIPSERHNGLRITPPEAMPIIADAAAEVAISLSETIREYGGRAVATPAGAITVETIDPQAYGRVGRVVNVRIPRLQSVLAQGFIPLIGCAHVSSEGVLLNVNADDVARSVALALEPQKIVFLTSTGGLLNADDAMINSVNLAMDWPKLQEAPWLQGGMRVKVEEIAQLLEQLPLRSSVSITSVDQMLRELFTHGGAGTLFRMGEKILVETKTDEAAMANLIETSFGRPLEQDFWQEFGRYKVIRTERMRAAALLRETGELTILDKFAVLPDARGEGLAKAVWAKIREETETLIWRSRANNPFNAFYNQAADGWRRAGDWHLFWCGEDGEAAFAAGHDLVQRPADFREAS